MPEEFLPLYVLLKPAFSETILLAAKVLFKIELYEETLKIVLNSLSKVDPLFYEELSSTLLKVLNVLHS